MNQIVIILIILAVVCLFCVSSILVGGYLYISQTTDTTTDTTSTAASTTNDASTTNAASTTTAAKHTDWACLSDINVPLRINAEGDLECMSQNNRDCLWRSNANECQTLLDSQPLDIKPLVCGDMHKQVWGITGYDNPDHWCTKGKNLIQ